MKIRLKSFLLITAFITVCLSFSACKNYTKDTKLLAPGKINTIGKLAEASKTKDDNLIYLIEHGEYEPYIILSNNYNNSVLLIRKNLSEEKIQYNTKAIFGTGGNYYAESNIDKYLNNEYIERYSTGLRQNILNTKIPITNKETINRSNYQRNTEIIERKIFLLSAEEVGIQNNFLAKEGSQLNWFDNENKLYSSEPQWLRTPYLWDDTHAWILDNEYNFSENITEKHSFRPALTLSRDLKIKKVKQDNCDIYVLDVDSTK